MQYSGIYRNQGAMIQDGNQVIDSTVGSQVTIKTYTVNVKKAGRPIEWSEKRVPLDYDCIIAGMDVYVRYSVTTNASVTNLAVKVQVTSPDGIVRTSSIVNVGGSFNSQIFFKLLALGILTGVQGNWTITVLATVTGAGGSATFTPGNGTDTYVIVGGDVLQATLSGTTYTVPTISDPGSGATVTLGTLLWDAAYQPTSQFIFGSTVSTGLYAQFGTVPVPTPLKSVYISALTFNQSGATTDPTTTSITIDPESLPSPVTITGTTIPNIISYKMFQNLAISIDLPFKQWITFLRNGTTYDITRINGLSFATTEDAFLALLEDKEGT